MAFYRICPDCGAYLDPGEQCSCHEERLIEMERKEKKRPGRKKERLAVWNERPHHLSCSTHSCPGVLFCGCSGAGW